MTDSIFFAARTNRLYKVCIKLVHNIKSFFIRAVPFIGRTVLSGFVKPLKKQTLAVIAETLAYLLPDVNKYLRCLGIILLRSVKEVFVMSVENYKNSSLISIVNNFLNTVKPSRINIIVLIKMI